VYRKTTFSGLGSSFFSFCSYQFKINGIKTLLSRAYNVCSNYQLLHNEFDFLRSFFTSNGYPLGLVNSHIQKFLHKKFEPNPAILTAAKNKLYFTFPYFGSQSDNLKRELTVLLSTYFPNISFQLIFVNTFKIGTFFRYKDDLPASLRSCLVYKFSCAQCASSYVGSTSRTLRVRQAEHAGISHRTGARLLVLILIF
jgi:hypothetical protein